MGARFIGKTVRERLVRVHHNRPSMSVVTPSAEEPIEVVENKEIKNTEDMMDINKVEDILNINGNEVKAPKRKIKYEKKERGLIEHTENSQIVINEDNKILLND